MLTKYLYVFFISMVPLVELAAAIPIGAVGLGLRMIPTCITAVVGNMIPVPILYLFARRVLEWGQDKPLIGKPCTFFMTKGKRGGEKLQATAGRGLFMALLLFVGIPLPGTGAWTGALIAALMEMRMKRALPTILLGVLIAGTAVTLISYFGVEALSFLLG